MTQPQDTTIRRRPDGSIDISFYARHAAQERRTAMHALPASLFRHVVRTVARLCRTSRDAVPSGPLLRYTGSPQD